ncbi:hypothetical protein GCM10011529_07140 [Polymorphobacter glacialis]|uniref:UrcA family protein n=1 Tax=Sandarakinorhabdus glacialis TaxID=1614636 RepID=A0A916ZMF3_9SPHN|nr:UrcA family protein [Polymorphobacter glacialis]GGE03258.1 hypothetical protein GCM10011529_07140 [Polymorphobacter glacialis]
MFANAFTAVSHAAVRTVIGAVGTVVLAGACLVGATAPAAAAEAPRTAYVKISDLNLGSTADRQRLEFRVNHAARQVCRTGSDDLRSRSDEANCVDAARAGAEAQTNVTIASRD